MTDDAAVLRCGLDAVRVDGVPVWLWDQARRFGWVHLADASGRTVHRLRLNSWGGWEAKDYRDGKTLTGYAGYHRPRRTGVPGLSAAGIRRALANMERQATGPVACCPTCRRRLPAGSL